MTHTNCTNPNLFNLSIRFFRNSWADRVRGVKTTAHSPVPVIESSNQMGTVPNPPACTGKVDTTLGFGDERKSIKNEDNCTQTLEMANGKNLFLN